MESMMGLINLNENEELLQEITLDRPLAALPFGGRYRLIDFALSNMVNSDMSNVGILLRDKYRSLMDHLRSGKAWDLARKRDGLFILPPAQFEHSMRGDLLSIYEHLDYLQRSRETYVLLSGSGAVCNLDFRQVRAFHQGAGADITVIFHQTAVGADDFVNCTTLDIGEDGRVVDLEVNASKVKTNKVAIGMYLIRRELLMDLVDRAVARGETDFVKGIILKQLHNLKIYGYAHEGYLGRIHSIASYYYHSMSLLRPEVWQEIFFQNGLVYTKVKDEAPAAYLPSSAVRNSLVANGCQISGTVTNSILFRGVKVQKDVIISDSLVMQNCEIGEGALLENVICDKDVKITKGKRLIGEKRYPLVIKKGTVI